MPPRRSSRIRKLAVKKEQTPTPISNKQAVKRGSQRKTHVPTATQNDAKGAKLTGKKSLVEEGKPSPASEVKVKRETSSSSDQLSAYELQRLENIRKNQAMLSGLDLGGGGLKASNLAIPRPTKPKKSNKRIRTEKPPILLRVSRRLRGEGPEPMDAEVLKRYNLYVSTLVDSSDFSQSAPQEEFLPIYTPYQKSVKPDSTFDVAPEFSCLVTNLSTSATTPEALGTLTLEEAEKTTDAELIQRIQGLRCASHEAVKMTQDRIYSMQFHPDPNKLLVAAGSKVGEVTLWDASLYAEEWRQGLPGPASAEDFDPASLITKLVTSSHDGTIRILDMENQAIVSALSSDLSLTSLDFAVDQPHTAFFSTYTGEIGFHDLRTTGLAQPTALFHFGKKKIGNLSLNPVRPHLLAASSNDRTLKLWDVRQLRISADPEPICKVDFPYSVTSAHWDTAGTRLVTTGFEHALRVLDVSAPEPGPELPLISKVPHNCRTGRFVTLLQAKFHPDPLIGHRVVAVADMKRGVDFYAAQTGRPLVRIADPHFITAIPAVLAFHPLATLTDSNSTLGSALACGNASGYAFLLI
ncbi:hypothetical protein L0F63_002202 [Massospora cicadina]|nr:hypothetical protein L0F63_002202 [Massospora cicadina]